MAVNTASPAKAPSQDLQTAQGHPTNDACFGALSGRRRKHIVENQNSRSCFPPSHMQLKGAGPLGMRPRTSTAGLRLASEALSVFPYAPLEVGIGIAPAGQRTQRAILRLVYSICSIPSLLILLGTRKYFTRIFLRPLLSMYASSPSCLTKVNS